MEYKRFWNWVTLSQRLKAWKAARVKILDFDGSYKKKKTVVVLKWGGVFKRMFIVGVVVVLLLCYIDWHKTQNGNYLSVWTQTFCANHVHV